MCIWSVVPEDRHCEFCSYRGGCEKHQISVGEDRSSLYIDLMSKIVGSDILQKSRNQTIVWARNMVAYCLRLDGLSLEKVGKILNLNHTSILYCERQVKRMLDRPVMYYRECELWQKFQNELSLNTVYHESEREIS